MARGITTGTRSRLVGIDIARGVAILGMLWVHFAPDGTGSAPPDGRSAILFATLAGVSLGLLTGGTHPPGRGSRLPSYRTIAIRGLLLIVLGRLLVLLATPVGIILDYYGVLFLILLVVLFAPRWVLAIVVLLSLSVGAWLIQVSHPNPSAAFGPTSPVDWPAQWLLTGIYPVALYGAFTVAGLIAARSDLARRRTQLTMLFGGAIVAPLGYAIGGALGVDAGAHANTTWEAVGSGGVAIAVIGLLQLASGLRVVRVALAPLADIGAMPLTIYTGQIVTASLFLLAQPPDRKYDIGYWWLLAAIVGGSLVFAVIWRRLVGRGPLEQVFALLSMAGRTIDGQPTAPGRPDAASPDRRPGRAVGVGLLAGAVGAAAVLALSLLVPPARTPVDSEAEGRTITAASGSMRFAPSSDLTGAGVEVDATGDGSASGSEVTLPITAGQVVAAADRTGGGVVLDGSGIALALNGKEVSLDDMLVDLDAGTIAGDLSADGATVLEDTLLARILPATPPPAGQSADGVRLKGLEVKLTSATAAAINGRLGAQAVAGGAVLGTAQLTITG